MSFDTQFCPVTADLNRHLAQLGAADARDRFLEAHAQDLYREILDDDKKLEELMNDVFGSNETTDAMFVAAYRGDVSAFRKIVEKIAMEAAVRGATS